MKRATSVILVMSMVFFSAAFLLLPSAALMGDVNGDGFVYADDARQILRYSAKLQDVFIRK